MLRKIVGKGLGLKGYAAGGCTGVGSVNQVAGIVHAGEFLANARATANPRNRMMLEAINREGYPGYTTGGYVRPVYMRGGGGLDAKAVVEALKTLPGGNQYTQQNKITPIQGVDPETITTVLGRELARDGRNGLRQRRAPGSRNDPGGSLACSAGRLVALAGRAGVSGQVQPRTDALAGGLANRVVRRVDS